MTLQVQAIILAISMLFSAVGGFYLSHRLDAADLIQAHDNVATGKANQAQLQQGLNTCNVSVDGIAKAGQTVTAAAQALIDQARAGADDYRRRIAALGAIKSTDEKCPAAVAILKQAFQ